MPRGPRKPCTVFKKRRNVGMPLNNESLIEESRTSHNQTISTGEYSLEPRPVSYTHLDVYKRQTVYCFRIYIYTKCDKKLLEFYFNPKNIYSVILTLSPLE